MKDEEKEEIPYVPKPIVCIDCRRPKHRTYPVKKPGIEKITVKTIKPKTDEFRQERHD